MFLLQQKKRLYEMSIYLTIFCNFKQKILLMKIILFSLIAVLYVQLTAAQSYTLPTLPYAYAEYAPQIDALTMEIHHSKHHQAYVNNLNKAVSGTRMESQSLIDLLFYAGFRSDVVRNNAGGHYNHSLFWDILAPTAKQTPITNDLLLAIGKDFKSMDSLKKSMLNAATNRFGSGWAWLMVNPDRQLVVSSTSNQDNPLMDVVNERGIPIVAIDVWEHAYYLNYQNKRMDYLNAVWSLIDWGVVSKKYEEAMKDSLLFEIEKDNWPAMKDFHKVMAQTFHPSENGDLGPIRLRSGEFLAKAILLTVSTPPKSLNNVAVKQGLLNLEKKCSEINNLVKKGAKDALLIKEMAESHDLFHLVQGLCHD